MHKVENPFNVADSDRFELWEMLVRRDITAFAAQDWSAHEADFLREEFFGVNSGNSGNPDSWSAAFGDLNAYAANWVAFAKQTAETEYAENPVEAHFRATTLRDIEINGSFAVAHKKFDGTIALADGGVEVLNWQTIYFCKKRQGRWLIASFIGYLPNPMGTPASVPKFNPDGTASSFPQLRPSPRTEGSGPGRPGLVVATGLPAEPDADLRSQARSAIERAFDQLCAGGGAPEQLLRIDVVLNDLTSWSSVQPMLQAALPIGAPEPVVMSAGLPGGALIRLDFWSGTEG
ncbi:hypothetical protein [Cucumibacter marinus]|uniref:hypothetical protein n=1 Tax=Cucumibacter marinus TaxID=1121252 RepID=UPI00041B5066